MSVKFSIIAVALNPGDKVKKTIDSILSQSYTDYEVIYKDGGSTDGSLDYVKSLSLNNLKIVTGKDSGIYDAMNMAVGSAEGGYVYFLNCGDWFYSADVLAKVASEIERIEETDSSEAGYILYGNIYDRITASRVSSNPAIDGFACYRNVPCHQACFYKRELICKHPFETKYKIRADYEQFLWCFYEGEASFKYMDLLIADYEGDGFSETKKNLVLSKEEHKLITEKYMEKKDLIKYRLILLLTLAPLRTALSKNKVTGRIYNGLKGLIYKR